MVSVAEQFGNLRDTLGSILGIFTMMRWIRTALAKITGRPPPADATALTPAAFGLPYLMSKMIKTFAANQEEEERRHQLAMEAQQPIDPSKLEFCRLLYDFNPQASAGGMELDAKKGDLVAVLTKADPAGQPSDWWQCRSRDGRQGYLPSTYLEVLKRPGQDVKRIKAAPAYSDSSRANSITSSSVNLGGKEFATLG